MHTFQQKVMMLGSLSYALRAQVNISHVFILFSTIIFCSPLISTNSKFSFFYLFIFDMANRNTETLLDCIHLFYIVTFLSFHILICSNVANM